MTPDTARMGFDYFEVIFYYKGTVARAEWEIGQRASIMDVYRTAGGIDYSAASRSLNPDAAAILLAGRKNDKTLLALGKLFSVDDEEKVTVINNRTSFVTFELSALTAAASDDRDKSSFITGSEDGGNPEAGNTSVISAFLGGKPFPLYALRGGCDIINAEYYFDLDGSWSDYEGGILVTGTGTIFKRQARYPGEAANTGIPNAAKTLRPLWRWQIIKRRAVWKTL
jgi:hypothetical protein